MSDHTNPTGQTGQSEGLQGNVAAGPETHKASLLRRIAIADEEIKKNNEIIERLLDEIDRRERLAANKETLKRVEAMTDALTGLKSSHQASLRDLWYGINGKKGNQSTSNIAPKGPSSTSPNLNKHGEVKDGSNGQAAPNVDTFCRNEDAISAPSDRERESSSDDLRSVVRSSKPIIDLTKSDDESSWIEL